MVDGVKGGLGRHFYGHCIECGLFAVGGFLNTSHQSPITGSSPQ
jgi:hypothetical protein